jgi:hypothetical protein
VARFKRERNAVSDPSRTRTFPSIPAANNLFGMSIADQLAAAGLSYVFGSGGR